MTSPARLSFEKLYGMLSFAFSSQKCWVQFSQLCTSDARPEVLIQYLQRLQGLETQFLCSASLPRALPDLYFPLPPSEFLFLSSPLQPMVNLPPGTEYTSTPVPSMHTIVLVQVRTFRLQIVPVPVGTYRYLRHDINTNLKRCASINFYSISEKIYRYPIISDIRFFRILKNNRIIQIIG